jgi:protein O-mannosyl-transferase
LSTRDASASSIYFVARRSLDRRPRSRAATVTRASLLERWWPMALIVLVGCLTYANSLRNPFIFDDEQTITYNEGIRHLTDLPAVLTPARELPTAGRPLVNLTFAINYALGGLDVVGYHAWNLATHLVCGLLLFAILRRTLAGQSGWPTARAVPLAFACVLLWLVHPLNTEAVDYVTERTELTMAAMLLLTLYAGLRALEPRRRMAWSIAAITACAVGMASKESMVTAPVLVGLFDRVFVFGSFREAWTTRKKLYLGLAATWILLGVLVATSPRGRSAGFSSGVSPTLYLLNQFPLVTRYLWLAVWPYSLVQNYGWPQPLALASVLPFAVFIGGLVLLTIAAFRLAPKLAFLGAWFWIALAPTSTVVPIATEVGAERRMYVPLMALVTLGVLGVAAAFARLGQLGRRASIAALGAATVALIAVTAVRNADYASPLRLARTTLARYPTPVAHHVLATELLAVGERQAALEELHLALPDAPRAHYTLGVELIEGGQIDEGIEELRAFISAQPHLNLVVDAHEYIGKAYAQRRQWPEAIAEFEAMLAVTPGNSSAEGLLAEAHFNAEDMDAAITHYERYVQSVASDADAFNHLGIALASKGRLDDAIAAFVRAEAANPQDGPVERNLAYSLYERHDIEDALVHAGRAVALQPDDERSQALLKTLEQLQPRPASAR